MPAFRSLPRPSIHSALWPALAACALALAVVLALGLGATGGKLTYALDDAYIHLALAEEIARGNYGVNPGEFAAVSSSILYPLLLVPLAHSSLQEYLPLLWGALGSALSVTLIVALLGDAVGPRTGGPHKGLVAVLAIIIALVFNLPGLPLLGMEHSLQIAASLGALWGLARLGASGRLPPLAAAAIVLGPLLRYENIALSLAAIACIAWLGRRRHAAGLLAATLAPLIAFSIFLYLANRQILPNPILFKAGVIGFDPWERAVGWIVGIRRGTAVFPALLCVALIVSLWRSPAARAEKAVGVTALAGLLAQIAAGGWDVLGRYSGYAVICGTMALLWMQRGPLSGAAERFGTLRLCLLTAMALAAATPTTALALLSLPQAQRNVFEQQYQLHRLAVDFVKAPVAVNDLGLVAWRNDNYVLDLIGIGDPEARRGQRAWLISAVEARGIEAAMIYEAWFAPVPANWIKIGEITLSGHNVNLGGATVAIFATRPLSAPRLRGVLQNWFATLPAGIRYRPF